MSALAITGRVFLPLVLLVEPVSVRRDLEQMARIAGIFHVVAEISCVMMPEDIDVFNSTNQIGINWATVAGGRLFCSKCHSIGTSSCGMKFISSGCSGNSDAIFRPNLDVRFHEAEGFSRNGRFRGIEYFDPGSISCGGSPGIDDLDSKNRVGCIIERPVAAGLRTGQPRSLIKFNAFSGFLGAHVLTVCQPMRFIPEGTSEYANNESKKRQRSGEAYVHLLCYAKLPERLWQKLVYGFGVALAGWLFLFLGIARLYTSRCKLHLIYGLGFILAGVLLTIHCALLMLSAAL